jgi:hypothetical protein
MYIHLMRALYASFQRNHERLIVMDVKNAVQRLWRLVLPQGCEVPQDKGEIRQRPAGQEVRRLRAGQ